MRGVFFHNGVYTTLEDAVRFYALRDSDPERVYGKGRRFDDLPAEVPGQPQPGGAVRRASRATSRR